MTTTHAESPTLDEPTLRGRAVDTLRQAAHLSHEARLLKTAAADAVEDAVHAAQRTIKRARHTALDARDELTYRVRREPLKAVALGCGVGLVLGVVLSMGCRRALNRRARTDG